MMIYVHRGCARVVLKRIALITPTLRENMVDRGMALTWNDRMPIVL